VLEGTPFSTAKAQCPTSVSENWDAPCQTPAQLFSKARIHISTLRRRLLSRRQAQPLKTGFVLFQESLEFAEVA
jgi:hypothetical protein